MPRHVGFPYHLMILGFFATVSKHRQHCWSWILRGNKFKRLKIRSKMQIMLKVEQRCLSHWHNNNNHIKSFSDHFCRSNSIRQCLAAEKSALSLKLVSAWVKESCHFLFKSVVMPSIVETCPSKNILFPITVSFRSPSLASTYQRPIKVFT